MEGNFKPPRELVFSGETANWKRFKQQFDIYMKATGLEKKDDETKIAIFMNIAGEDALDIFNTLKLTEEEKKSYKKVLEAFENYCIPRKNVIVESFKFFGRAQKPEESFDHFLTELKIQARLCEFGDQEERLIRDRIVVGINDSVLQERLLRESDLTLEKAISYCRATETGKTQARELKEKIEVAAVKAHRENENKPRDEQVFKCKRCGRNHNKQECPAFGKVCACKNKNHFAVMCKTAAKNKNTSKREDKGKGATKKKIHEMTVEANEEEEFALDSILNEDMYEYVTYVTKK